MTDTSYPDPKPRWRRAAFASTLPLAAGATLAGECPTNQRVAEGKGVGDARSGDHVM